jgi:flagellar biosynthesis protein FliQ
VLSFNIFELNLIGPDFLRVLYVLQIQRSWSANQLTILTDDIKIDNAQLAARVSYHMLLDPDDSEFVLFLVRHMLPGMSLFLSLRKALMQNLPSEIKHASLSFLPKVIL